MTNNIEDYLWVRYSAHMGEQLVYDDSPASPINLRTEGLEGQ